MFQCIVISATERNFSASANSKNPSTTFTEFIQLPERGNEFNQLGKAANKVNGIAKALENPSITTNGPKELVADWTNAEPIIGPVQEKETNAKVNAMKKIPKRPPLSAMVLLLLAHELGNVIS